MVFQIFSSEIFSRKVNKRFKIVPIRATGLIAFIVVKAFAIFEYRLLKVEKRKKEERDDNFLVQYYCNGFYIC